MAYYKASNSFIAQYYIFFGNSDSIVSSEACFYSVEKFFKSIYGANKHETIEEYVQYLKEYHYRKVLPSTEVYISNSMNNVINYMQSIPIDLPNIQKATVVL